MLPAILRQTTVSSLKFSQAGSTSNGLTSAALMLLIFLGMGAVGVSAAIANPEGSTPSKVTALNTNAPITGVREEASANEAEPQTVVQAVEPASSTRTEIDTSITREYEPVTIYLPDSSSQELVPQSVLVTTDAPVTMAVNQIVDQYEGQDVGITGYEVNVDTQAREAAINFEVNHPRGEDVFQSLSSANQYSLFEAIRETLLTQPVYGIDEVIFQANDTPFNI
jgi:hypothetical protein